jgi:very-short-patch-repair endonuclease
MLWKILRDRRLADLKFRRQVPLGRYIADFACFRHRLIVEADGPWHDPDEDRVRDAWLSGQGFKVLRFSNGQISARPHEIIAAIADAVTPPAERRVNAKSNPSPRAGEGGRRQAVG